MRIRNSRSLLLLGLTVAVSCTFSKNPEEVIVYGPGDIKYTIEEATRVKRNGLSNGRVVLRIDPEPSPAGESDAIDRFMKMVSEKPRFRELRGIEVVLERRAGWGPFERRIYTTWTYELDSRGLWHRVLPRRSAAGYGSDR